jgi:2-keto-4-pentenoate hydratase/2-oxohepta-3-ene-1,7-dioic acid hydratase in catechol pathway
MRIATCKYHDQVHLAVVQDNSVLFPAMSKEWSNDITSMLQLIDAGAESLQALQKIVAQASTDEWVPLPSVELISPIPRPRQNIMCLGWNYIEHVEETAGKALEAPKLPKYPIVFTKAASSMNGPYAEIPVDLAVSNKMDWEVELAVIIGKAGQGIAKENALDHVFGYSIINDISARDIQKRHKQFFVGKSFTGACPMGPWIVTADEIADPQNLDLKSWVNNDIKQDSNTKYQIFDVASVIETLSQGMILEVGDIIATGTPSGVGYVRNPPEYLMPGDVVDCEIEGIGKISNPIVSK